MEACAAIPALHELPEATGRSPQRDTKAPAGHRHALDV